MNNKDLQDLIESYNEVVEENLLRRLKSYGKGALAGGSRALNGAIGKPGDYNYTKNKAIVEYAVKDIQAALDDFLNDLQKMGVISTNSEANFRYVSKFIMSIVKNMAYAGGKNVTARDLIPTFDKAGLKPEPVP